MLLFTGHRFLIYLCGYLKIKSSKFWKRTGWKSWFVNFSVRLKGENGLEKKKLASGLIHPGSSILTSSDHKELQGAEEDGSFLSGFPWENCIHPEEGLADLQCHISFTSYPWSTFPQSASPQHQGIWIRLTSCTSYSVLRKFFSLTTLP